jgi:tRNA pseudouridine55 synthase
MSGTDGPHGLLLVDKPVGWTSHDVVARVRRLAGTRRVGHAGTLDPMASGVLVLGLGKGTKLLTFLVGCDKDYVATVRLGEVRSTDDAEGEVIASHDPSGVTAEAVSAAVAGLTGAIEQVPSTVSAIKVAGQRAYARARAGEDVVLAPRAVTVARFETGPLRMAQTQSGHAVVDLDIAVSVSSGTYVRALARDLGQALGVGGHLTALRRTRVGGFGLDRAHDLDELGRTVADGGALPVLPLGVAARSALPVRELAEAEARAAAYGQPLSSAQPGRSEPVAAFAPDGTLVAVLDESGTRARDARRVRPRRFVECPSCECGTGWPTCRATSVTASSPSATSTAFTGGTARC